MHDETNHKLALMLADLEGPDMPVVIGVLYCNPAPVYEEQINESVKAAKEKKPDASMKDLLYAGSTWTVD